jgi:hypothetical protein
MYCSFMRLGCTGVNNRKFVLNPGREGGGRGISANVGIPANGH